MIIFQSQQIPFKRYSQLQNFVVGNSYIKDILDFLDHWYDPTLSEIIVPTSGSTGTPKKISLSKKSMIKSAEKSASYFKFKSGQRTLLGLPVKYIAGIMMLVRAIESDMDIVLTKPSAENLLDVMNPDEHLDFIPMTPFQLLESYKKHPNNLNRIKKILLGGGPLSQNINVLIPKIKPRLYHGFGMTETITHIAIRELAEDQDSLYEGLPGVRFDVDDQSRLSIHADHLGEVIHTNDIVKLSGEISFKWLGRSDNVINSGGVKLFPEQIELKLASIIKNPFFIYKISDLRLGQRPVLFIESSEMAENDLILRISKALEKYEIPDNIYTIESFQRTSTGKIKRRVTAEKYFANN